MKNITLSRTDAVPKRNPFREICRTRKLWKGLIRHSEKTGASSEIRGLIEQGRVLNII